MESLIKNSIHVRPGTPFTWEKHTCVFNVSETACRFNGKYAIDDEVRVIAFNSDREMYVTPYDVRIVEALQAAGFTEGKFYIPFADKSYPAAKADQEKWSELCRQAEEIREAQKRFAL